RSRLLDLRPDLLDPPLDRTGLARALDARGLVLVHDHLLGLPEILELDVLQLDPEILVIALPPVRVAMSSSISLRRSPKPGALTAQVWSVPRSLLTTSVASASPSTSSAMISSGLPARATCSSSGSMSFI